MNGTWRTGVSYNESFNFSTLHLLRAVTLCTSLCMYHLSLYQVWRLKYSITWDIDSAILWTALSALAYLIKQKFQFLNTSICYELLLCVHHYACTTSACTKVLASQSGITWDIDSAIMWDTEHALIKRHFFLDTLHLLRAVTLCTSLCMYHLSLSQVWASLKHSITWDIDSAILWMAQRTSVSQHTNKVSISQHLHLLRAVTLYTSLCMYHLSLYQV
jgi:hypothetical protein